MKLAVRMTLALAVVASLAVAAPASAEQWSGRDRARDHVPPGTGQDYRGHGDIVRLSVDHARHRVYVRTTFRTGAYDDMTAFLDLRPRRRGPEVALYASQWGVSLWRTGPRRLLGDRLRCDATGERLRDRTWAAHVSRRCLARALGTEPTRVRAWVHSSDETGELTSDWAPGKRRGTPWLASGER